MTTGDVNPSDPTTWDSSTIGYIGKPFGGTMNISGGSDVIDRSGYIGSYSGSTGVVTVDGTGSTWTNSSDLLVGHYGTGTLNITGGGAVSNRFGYIGNYSGSTGMVTLNGAGSTWTNNSGLFVGYSGNGTLDITGGGAVTVAGHTWVAMHSGSSGTINFDTGTLTTDGLLCALDDLTGTGTINTHGLVSDVNLVFDATHGLSQTFYINNNSGQDITLNLNVDNSGSMGAGFTGFGTMNISDGIVVESTIGYIGYYSGSTGVVTVDGTGSTWTNNGELHVGDYGSGTLNITGGGEVTVAGHTWVAMHSGSSGTINFDTGTLTTDGLVCALDDLTGTGTINTHGLVSDVDLVFDATHGPNQTIDITDHPGQNITLNLNVDNSGSMGAGFSSVGTMNISDGIAVESTTGYIGYYSGSTGAVTVDGAGSTWTNNSSLFVGRYGSGTLDITDGGTVSNSHGYIGCESGSTGVVTVDGTGSKWTSGSSSLAVGYRGNGTLNITGGGAVSNSYFGYIGSGSDSTGVVTVDGTGSKWNNNGELYVGNNGSGTLDITNGGAVRNKAGYIGYGFSSTSVVTVDGAGSTWANSGGLYVGHYGSGVLDITGGGAISNGYYGYIGYGPGSTGVVTVDGAGSTWTNATKLYVGRSGSGTLNITGGGTVSNISFSGYAGYIGYNSDSTGVVTVNGTGSKWTSSSTSLVVGYKGNGTLNITGGGAVNNRFGYIGNYSGSTGVVTVDGAGSTWTNSSDLYVGRYSCGTLNITGGGLVDVAVTLFIDTDNDGDSFINMSTGGMLALHGEADDSLASFLGLIDGTGAIRYWDDSISDWADINGATYGRDYTLSYQSEGNLASYTVLTVERAVDGDANHDHIVDVSDLGVLATHYDQGGGFGWDDADFTGDGIVDVCDLGILATNYDNSIEATTSQAVPEPSTLFGLLVLCLVGLLVSSRRKR